jgi:hypothetical protein
VGDCFPASASRLSGIDHLATSADLLWRLRRQPAVDQAGDHANANAVRQGVPVGLLSPYRLPSGGSDSHSCDLDRMVAALFDTNRFHCVPGEHKACYHLGREALSHQFRIGDTTQAGIGQYF